MIALRWLAAAVLFLHWPIPLYWLAVHPQVGFWRRHVRSAYAVGVLASWLPVTAGMIVFRGELFRPRPSVAAVIAGSILIVCEIWMVARVHAALGTARLVGRTELTGGGEMATTGIYSYVRHPRYTGSFLAVLGACLMAGSRAMWIGCAAWVVMMRLAIGFEERELRGRFGRAYERYSDQVPGFFPWIGS